MKINVISDIHLNINPVDGKPVYGLSDRFDRKYILGMFKVISDYWKNDASKRGDLDFKNYCLDEDFGIRRLEDADDVNRLLDRYEKALSGDISSFGRTKEGVEELKALTDEMFSLSELFNHERLYSDSKGKWFDFHILNNYLYSVAGTFDPSLLEPADYLVVAGDLGYDNTYDTVLDSLREKTDGKFKDILHIAGNHDHWYMGKVSDREFPDNVNLSRDFFEKEDGDYVFLGCTLWTPVPDESVYKITRCMNDYRYTPNFTVYKSREQYRIQSEWLRSRLDRYKDRKVVVLTHHQPFEELIPEEYRDEKKYFRGTANEAYVVTDHSLDDVNKNGNIVLWCCGHTHKCYDGVLHGVHVVRNPIGYREEYGFGIPENFSGTWYNKIVEI